MTATICFLVHDNLYDSKRHFTHHLTKALERQGAQVTIIDLKDGELQHAHVQKIIDTHPDFTASFNAIEPVGDSQYLWDLLKIPHLSLLVDPAVYSLKLTKSPYSWISCVDQQDLSLLHSTGCDRSFFLPHAVPKELCEDTPTEKPYDIVFIGTCYDPDEWKNDISKELWPSVEVAIEKVLKEPFTTIQEALLQLWKDAKPDPSQHNFLDIFRAIDFGARARDRIDLIRNVDAGRIHIFGEGEWANHLKDKPNVHLHHAVSYPESLEVLKKAKVCLNSMPFFKHGSHERLFAGLACQALVVNSPSKFIQEQFPPTSGVITYQYGQWDQLNAQLNSYSDVHEGHHIVKNHHTWDHRARQLLTHMAT